MEQIIEIPITKAIKSFRDYLDYNNRGILSASFGDGKTYFLDKFKKEYEKDFTFITLYPVNYQVADNKDIFELIKRDILVQMIGERMIETEYEIGHSLLLPYFIMHNGCNIISDIFLSLQYLNLPTEQVASFIAVSKGLTVFQSALKSYIEYKKEIEEQEDKNNITNYLNLFDNGLGCIYGYDIITRIITDNLLSYKSRTQKKIALIIEDLDRLDPAHIFRMLNILSAHIDRQFMSLEETCNHGAIENKFGFDKILIVCDYKNTKKIFQHFYGKDTKFDGYIHKFSPLAPFNYSFEKVAIEYLIEEIEKISGIDKSIIKEILDSQNIPTINARTITEVFKNINEQIRGESITINDTIKIKSSNGILQFLVILKRLGFSNNDYKNLSKYFQENWANVIKPFGLLIILGINHTPPCSIYMPTGQYYKRVDLEFINDKDGVTKSINYTVSKTLSISNNKNELPRLSFDSIFQKALEYIK